MSVDVPYAICACVFEDLNEEFWWKFIERGAGLGILSVCQSDAEWAALSSTDNTTYPRLSSSLTGMLVGENPRFLNRSSAPFRFAGRVDMAV